MTYYIILLVIVFNNILSALDRLSTNTATRAPLQSRG